MTLIRSASTTAARCHRVFTDAACRGNPGPSAAAAILISPGGQVISTSSSKLGRQTNNAAEYRACYQGLRLALSHSVTHLLVYTDSQLVVNQIHGTYRVMNPNLQPLHSSIRSLSKSFKHIKFIHIPRSDNKQADKLANTMLSST